MKEFCEDGLEHDLNECPNCNHQYCNTCDEGEETTHKPSSKNNSQDKAMDPKPDNHTHGNYPDTRKGCGKKVTNKICGERYFYDGHYFDALCSDCSQLSQEVSKA